MEEIFKDIPNYEGMYQASNLGNVKSLARKDSIGRRVDEKVLKPRIDKYGYLRLSLNKYGKRKTRHIHQLVAEAFLGHTPCGMKLVVNHINFIRHDNRAENLELDTTRNNSNLKHIKSSSEYTGVSWNKSSEKWMASIHINGKTKYLGYFTDETEASKAYQKALSEII
tara:strand:+ start:106 stop:609 length:504 start_codon:yes stop_codon:yes gene_type:complete